MSVDENDKSPDTQYSESTDATQSGLVMMPVGSVWACRRVPAALSKQGTISSGFACSDGVGTVGFFAACAGTKAAADRAHGALFDKGNTNMVTFTVRCETMTSSSNGRPGTPIEKNL